MDQNELEGMAERCGWGQGNTWDDCMCCSTFDLEAFAKLVAEAAASKERDEWAKEFAGLGEWTAVHILEARGEA
jgi:hypothetical protein